MYFVVNGQLLTEEFKITWSRTSNAQRVNTTAKGFAGLSPGTPMLEAEITNAIPAAGFEFDMGQIIASLSTINAQIIGPGRVAIVCPGFVEKDNGSHSVGSASEYSFNFVASLQQFQ